MQVAITDPKFISSAFEQTEIFTEKNEIATRMKAKLRTE